MRKNLTFLINSLNTGGAENVVTQLANFLANDYTVNIVLLENTIKFKLNNNINIHVLTKFKIIEPLFYLLLPIWAYKYSSYLKSINSDTSISFLSKCNFLNCLIKLFSKKTRVIISERTNPTNYFSTLPKWKKIMNKLLTKKLFNKADLLITNSNHAATDLYNNFRIKIPIATIYNSVKEFKIDNEPFKFQSSEFNIVCVSNFRPEKNHKDILLALSNTKNKNNIKIYLIGEGDCSYIKKLIEKYNLIQNIIIIGQHQNPYQFLCGANLLLLFSLFEGLPNVVLESMAANLPVLVSATAGSIELVSDKPITVNDDFCITERGVVVPIAKPDILAKAIDYCYENQHVLNQIKRNYPEYIKKFSVKEIAKEFEKFI